MEWEWMGWVDAVAVILICLVVRGKLLPTRDRPPPPRGKEGKGPSTPPQLSNVYPRMNIAHRVILYLRDLSCLLRCSLRLKALLQNFGDVSFDSREKGGRSERENELSFPVQRG